MNHAPRRGRVIPGGLLVVVAVVAAVVVVAAIVVCVLAFQQAGPLAPRLPGQGSPTGGFVSTKSQYETMLAARSRIVVSAVTAAVAAVVSIVAVVLAARRRARPDGHVVPGADTPRHSV